MGYGLSGHHWRIRRIGGSEGPAQRNIEVAQVTIWALTKNEYGTGMLGV